MEIVVLTGAGMSAESGVKTFRDSNGLWEGYDVMEVASPMGFENNPETVLEFYNQRRRQLLTLKPNAAHYALAELEKTHKVTVITQNVDDLHERAGSTNVMHLHGELLKVRSTGDENYVQTWEKDLVVGDLCPENHQLRPHIVWFGEYVPLIFEAEKEVEKADILIIIGTSMQVYPAAGLLGSVREGTPIFFIDPKPNVKSSHQLTVIAEQATFGTPKVIDMINNLANK